MSQSNAMTNTFARTQNLRAPPLSEMCIEHASPCRTGTFYKHVKLRPNGRIQTHFYLINDATGVAPFMNTTRDGHEEEGISTRYLQSHTALRRFCTGEKQLFKNEDTMHNGAISTLVNWLK
jgi:hypothetical protein